MALTNCYLRFNSTDSAVFLNSAPISTLGRNFSVSFWVKWGHGWGVAPEGSVWNPFAFHTGCYTLGSFGYHQVSIQISPQFCLVNLSWEIGEGFDLFNYWVLWRLDISMWHNVVVTVDDLNIVSIYLNGSRAGQSLIQGVVSNGADGTPINADGHEYVIGNAWDWPEGRPADHPYHTAGNGYPDSQGNPRYFGLGADMDEFRLYTRCLAAEEIYELYMNWWEHYEDSQLWDSGLAILFHMDEGTGSWLENDATVGGPDGEIQNCTWVCDALALGYPTPSISAVCRPDPIKLGEPTFLQWVSSLANYVDVYEISPNSGYIGRYSTVGSLQSYPYQQTTYLCRATRTDEPRGNPYTAEAEAIVHMTQETDYGRVPRLIISDSGNFRLISLSTASLSWLGALGTVKRYQYGQWDWYDDYPIGPVGQYVDDGKLYINERHGGAQNEYYAGAYTVFGLERDEYFRSDGAWDMWVYYGGNYPNFVNKWTPNVIPGLGVNSPYLYIYDRIYDPSCPHEQGMKDIWNVRNKTDFTSVSCATLDTRSWWGVGSFGYPYYAPIWNAISGSQGLHGDIRRGRMHPYGSYLYTAASRFTIHADSRIGYPPINVLRKYDMGDMSHAAVEALTWPASETPKWYLDVGNEYVYLLKTYCNSPCLSVWTANSLVCVNSGVVIENATNMGLYSGGEGISFYNNFVYLLGYGSSVNSGKYNFIHKIDVSCPTATSWSVVGCYGTMAGSIGTAVSSDVPDAAGYLYMPKYPSVDRATGILYLWDSQNYVHKSFDAVDLAYRASHDFQQTWGDQGTDNRFYEPAGIAAKNFSPNNNLLAIACPGAFNNDAWNFPGSDFKGHGTQVVMHRTDLVNYVFGRYTNHWDSACWHIAIHSAWQGDGISGAYDPDPPGWHLNPVGLTLDNSAHTYIYLNEANYNQQAIVKFHPDLSIIKTNTYGGGGVYPPTWYSSSGYSYYWEFMGMDFDVQSNDLYMVDWYSSVPFFAWMSNSLVWAGSMYLDELPYQDTTFVFSNYSWHGQAVCVFSKHIYIAGDGVGCPNILVLDKDTKAVAAVFSPTNPNANFVRYSAICHDDEHLYMLDPYNACVDKYRPDMTLVLRSQTKYGMGEMEMNGPMGMTFFDPKVLGNPFASCNERPNQWSALGYTPQSKETGLIPFHMFKIRIGTGAEDYITLTNGDRPIQWNGRNWDRFPATIGPVKSRSAITDPVKVTASNVDRYIIEQMTRYKVTGKEITIYKCYWNEDFTHTEPYIVYNGQVTSYVTDESENTAKVDIEVKPEHWNWQRQIPNAQYGLNCQWIFKSTTPGCQYTGVGTKCDRSYNNCLRYGNTDRFRGFRYWPVLESVEVWWGKEKKT